MANRKALQLCAQVSKALNFALSNCAACHLNNLYIEEVVPAPDSTQLLAKVVVPEDLDKYKVLEHLEKAYGYLRIAVAHEITEGGGKAPTFL